MTRTWRLLDDVRADVRYGLRWLRRSPGFAAAAVLSLGLGIGANTAVFSLIDTVMLKSLPVAHPEELVLFAYQVPDAPSASPAGPALSNVGLTYKLVDAFRRESRMLAGVIASGSFQANVEIDGASTPVARGQIVSGDYYAVLGVPAARGRLILKDDDGRPGDGAVAVLSDAYWQRQFGGDPRAIGRTVRVNGYPLTIIGVTPPEFFGTRVGERPDITVPLAMQLQVMPDVGVSWISGEGVYQFWLEGMGRLKPGVSLAQAQAELDGVFRREMLELVAIGGPKALPLKTARLDLQPGSQGLSELRRRFSRPLAIVMVVVALVLLIACANLANLLLARAAARQREMAVRVSLGAGRARLVRQLLTESFVLALTGGLVGVLIAVWASQALAASLVDGAGQALTVSLDLRVLGFALGVSCLTAMCFGLMPALGASRVQPQAALTMGRQAESGRRTALGRLLVAGQVATSLLLLIGAGLFVRTLMHLREIDAGFTRETVLLTRLEPRGSNQKAPHLAELQALYGDLLARVRALPGVRAVSLSGVTPLGTENPLATTLTATATAARPGEEVRARVMQIYPDYFAALGIPILAGRDLAPSDNLRDSHPVTVINEALAVRVFGSVTAALGRDIPVNRDTVRIVGVAGNVRDRGLREATGPVMYSTYAKTNTGRGQMTLLVRVAGDPAALAPVIRDHVRRIDQTMPLRDIESVEQRIDSSLRQERLVALLSSGFGLLALLLACIGLYGVMAYGVARRRAEFGLRLALGASRADVSWLVLRETLIVIAVGIAIGVPLALTLSRLVAFMLFGLTPTDPVTLVAAVLILTAVATLAGYLPARRAGRVDPLVALRQD